MNFTSTSDTKHQPLDLPKDDVFLQQFSVPYAYPVHFTEALFDTDNAVFQQVISARSEPGPQRTVIFVDAGVVAAMPELCTAIQRYCQLQRQVIDLVAEPITVDAGESLKSDSSMLARLQEVLARHKLDRHSYVVAIGGGALLDTIGLVAATAHRGIRHIRIPTTVLAQNDSGVGVKNGVNLFGQKNYFGTFAPPFAVINDYAFIEALPKRDKIAGMAEAVKVALIRDPEFFNWLEANTEKLAGFEKNAMQYMIRRCAQLHMHQIAHGGDPFETGSARPLDFGHWAAHKLEAISAFSLRHGEAVAIGIALDTCYSVQFNLLEAGAEQRVYTLLQSLGFTLWHPALMSTNAEDQLRLLQGLEEFREHLGGQLTITLLEAIGSGIEVHSIDTVAVCESIAWLRQKASAIPGFATQGLTHNEKIIDLSARRQRISQETKALAVTSNQRGLELAKIPSDADSALGDVVDQIKTSVQQSKRAENPTVEELTRSIDSTTPDTAAACEFLHTRLKQQLSSKHYSWFSARLNRLTHEPADRDLFITLGMIPRKLGRDDLNICAPDIIAAQTQSGVAWNPFGWSVDNAARCVVLGQLLKLQAERFDKVFSELCQCAELGESIAYYRCTAVLPRSKTTDEAVSAGLRTHIRAVFEAIAHGNPYPNLHFDTNRWNHMVLKALFINSTLWQIHGLDERANPELAQMLCDYAHERWAADRSVSPELWRCVGPFASGSMIDDLERVLTSRNTRESLGALMALLSCPDTDHEKLRKQYPECCEQIDKGVLSWERLGRNITDGN